MNENGKNKVNWNVRVRRACWPKIKGLNPWKVFELVWMLIGVVVDLKLMFSCFEQRKICCCMVLIKTKMRG